MVFSSFQAVDLLRKQLGHRSTSKLHVMLADLLSKNHDDEQAMEHYRICELRLFIALGPSAKSRALHCIFTVILKYYQSAESDLELTLWTKYYHLYRYSFLIYVLDIIQVNCSKLYSFCVDPPGLVVFDERILLLLFRK